MLGPWIKVNWKSSNEMARVNIDILGISELKCMNLIQMTIIFTIVGNRRNGVDFIVNITV